MNSPFPDVERIAIHTADGLGLRAEYRPSPSADGSPPRALAVLCHPHPLHGGNMHNHVIATMFAALPSLGVPTMRFNFRGTSGSEGRHGGGTAERLDVVAAIEALTDRHRHRQGPDSEPAAEPPVVLVGYSFGALVALAVDHGAIGGWLAIAPPLPMAADKDLVAATDPRPTVVLAGTADEFCSAAEAERCTAGWVGTAVATLDGENHGLATAADRLKAETAALVDRIAAG